MKKRKRKLAMAILGSTIAVYLFFRYLFFVFFPIILALGVGKILMPAIRFLKRKCHLPRVISVVLPVTFFFCFFVVALYYLVGMLCGQLVSIAQNLPYYQEIINTGVNQICNWCDGIFFVEEGTAFAYFSMQFNSILEKFSSDGIPNITLRAFQILKKLVGWAGTFGVVIIVTCMVVKDMEELREKYRNSIFYEDIHALLRPLTQVGFAYAKAQGIIIFLVACVCVIGFYLTGSNYALLFGIFVAVFDAFNLPAYTPVFRAQTDRRKNWNSSVFYLIGSLFRNEMFWHKWRDFGPGVAGADTVYGKFDYERGVSNSVYVLKQIQRNFYMKKKLCDIMEEIGSGKFTL